MKAGYFTVPPLTCAKPTGKKPVIVEDFIIGRVGHGEIFFPGKTNLENVDLDSVVHFNECSVVVYPGDSNKPDVGQGLNRAAVVTLHRVWKKSSETTTKFQERLKCVTKKMGAEFLKYSEPCGSWTFRVQHFSKYGLNDSDEEVDPQANVNSQKVAQIPSQNVIPGKGALNGQNIHMGLLGRPTPLEMEQTIQRHLFCDQSYSEDEENMNQFSDPKLQLIDDLNQLNKTGFMSPSQAILNCTVNNERLCDLKATLFDDDIMEDETSETFSEVVPVVEHKRRREEPKMLLHVDLPLLIDSSRDLPVIQSGQTESPIFRTPRRLAAKQFFETTPHYKSLLYSRHNMLIDAGCFHGLSFRVGWGPKMRFVHKCPISLKETVPPKLSIIPLVTSSKPLPAPHTLSTVHCSTLYMSSVDSSIFCSKENILENLKVQLLHKTFCEIGDVPFFSTRDGVDLLKSHLGVCKELSSQNQKLQDAYTVWNLCNSLWGHCPEEESPNSYNYHRFRKELFLEWLISTTSSDMNKEVQNARQQVSAIFSLLTCNCIVEACTKAVEINDLRLGLLLSQAGSFITVRSSILRQLENWFQFEVDQFIDANRVKIYALLGGKLVWKTSKGTVVNCCEDLDWKRALLLHLCYHCLPTASIQEVLLAYEKAFLGSGPHGQYATFPYPSYVQNDPELLLLASQSEGTPLDMCYYLLKLYCDRSTPLLKMLVPLTYGFSQLDYSLSWMVHEVLLALGYQHLPYPQSQMLHVNFASQLESIGLWEWSVFVLLHTKEAVRRKKLVMEVLIRHITLNPSKEDNKIETFLTDELHIPSTWLYAAKAVLAKSVGNYKEEAWCLLKSKEWNKSHQIIIEKIAPDCIIHEQFDYLKSFLTELSSPEISGTILDWPTGGEVYLDYIHVSEKIEQMIADEVRAYEIEELHPRLISLSNRISNLQCLGAKGRLCQSEMSKKTVTLLRALLALRRDIRSGGSGASGNSMLTSLLPKLPMPEDYALQEMRAIVRSYMLEVTSTERNFP